MTKRAIKPKKKVGTPTRQHVNTKPSDVISVVGKYGNGLYVPVRSAMAAELGLSKGDYVRVRVTAKGLLYCRLSTEEGIAAVGKSERARRKARKAQIAGVFSHAKQLAMFKEEE